MRKTKIELVIEKLDKAKDKLGTILNTFDNKFIIDHLIGVMEENIYDIECDLDDEIDFIESYGDDGEDKRGTIKSFKNKIKDYKSIIKKLNELSELLVKVDKSY